LSAADWETVCAEARKSPSQQGVSGVSALGKPLPDAKAVPPEAHESLISSKTVADVPLTGLSFAVVSVSKNWEGA